MFSPDIVSSDAFLDMPISSQALYFHLGMHADDDGFVNPKKVMRLTNAADDDLKMLVAKRFVLTFQSGVVVVKHWLIHNLIRKDRYKPTRYTEEKNALITKENGAYSELTTNGLPNDNQMTPQVRLGKVNTGASPKPKIKSYSQQLLDWFNEKNPALGYANKTEWDAADWIFQQKDENGNLLIFDEVKKIVEYLWKRRTEQYAHLVTKPTELKNKWLKIHINEERKTKNGF